MRRACCQHPNPPPCPRACCVLQVIRLTEEETTSSSRIFIKILFQVRCGWARMWALHIAKQVSKVSGGG